VYLQPTTNQRFSLCILQPEKRTLGLSAGVGPCTPGMTAIIPMYNLHVYSVYYSCSPFALLLKWGKRNMTLLSAAEGPSKLMIGLFATLLLICPFHV
jgi:hypothetical protein